MSKGDSVKGLVWVALFGASLVAVGSTRGWGEALRAVKWLVVFSSPALLLLLVMGLLLGVVWLLHSGVTGGQGLIDGRRPRSGASASPTRPGNPSSGGPGGLTEAAFAVIL